MILNVQAFWPVLTLVCWTLSLQKLMLLQAEDSDLTRPVVEEFVPQEKNHGAEKIAWFLVRLFF